MLLLGECLDVELMCNVLLVVCVVSLQLMVELIVGVLVGYYGVGGVVNGLVAST